METQREASRANKDWRSLKEAFGPVAATLAVGLFLWQAKRPDGWLEAAFGGLAVLFWVGAALWLVSSILAIQARHHWWVIATAPFALYPISMVAILLAACTGGNCL